MGQLEITTDLQAEFLVLAHLSCVTQDLPVRAALQHRRRFSMAALHILKPHPERTSMPFAAAVVDMEPH
ncbi:TPA: hypothetical protein PFA69_002909 [Serratia marcescens]|nr:hypothetical protein [Serratia marcescens]